MANLRKISHLTPSTTMGKMLAFLLLGLLTAPLAAALNVQFCNSMNTNTDTSSKATYTYEFMSHGECYNFCVGMKNGVAPAQPLFAYAIVQGFDCWCSDWVPDPAKEADKVSDCNLDCPGYDKEKCGNLVEGLYGYIKLAKRPEGTRGVQSSSTTETPAPTADPSGTPAETTPAGSGAPDPDGQNTSTTKKSFWDSKGKVIGFAVGITLLIAFLLGALGIFLWRRRRRDSIPLGGESPTPNGIPPISERRNNGRMAIPIKRNNGFFKPSVLAPTPELEDPEVRPVMVDQRLDPAAWGRDNASRLSVRSLRDDQDYSRRVLRVTNATPDD